MNGHPTAVHQHPLKGLSPHTRALLLAITTSALIQSCNNQEGFPPVLFLQVILCSSATAMFTSRKGPTPAERRRAPFPFILGFSFRVGYSRNAQPVVGPSEAYRRAKVLGSTPSWCTYRYRISGFLNTHRYPSRIFRRPRLRYAATVVLPFCLFCSRAWRRSSRLALLSAIRYSR